MEIKRFKSFFVKHIALLQILEEGGIREGMAILPVYACELNTEVMCLGGKIYIMSLDAMNS